MIRSILRPAPQILLAIALASCGAQSTSCGCLGNITPLAQPLNAAHTTQAGAQAYVTPGGLTFLDNNVGTLAGTLLPGGLTFWVPESEVKTGCVFGACLIDEYLCRAGDCSYSNPTDCNENGAAPNGACPISVKLDTLTLGTQAPDTLSATLTMDIDWNEWGLDGSGNCVLGGTGGSCRNVIWMGGTVGCGLDLTLDQQPIPITVLLTIDPISQALSINVTNVSVSLSDSDFSFNCGVLGDIINFFGGVIDFASFFNGTIQSMISSQVAKQLQKQFCMPPTFYTSGCPSGSVTGQDVNGDTVCCAPGTNCANKTGDYSGCVAKPLGLVGVADLSSFLAKYGAPQSKLQLAVFPGQANPPSVQPLIAQNGDGLRARVVTGVEALQPSSCVPSRPAPPTTAQPDIDFDTEAKNAGISSYMVGVGLSKTFLNAAAYEAYNSGLLCLDINSYNESLLSTSLLTPVLPSLGYIAPDNAAWAVLRPQNPPTITVGAGTLQNGQIVDPLLNVSMKDLRIDLFASVDERPVRLFAISADVEIPLALTVGASGSSLDVVLGNLNNILVNLSASQSNILAENPSQLLKLIPLVLQLAGPSLAKMPSFNLPSLSGFGITLDGIHGIVNDPDGGYDDVGLFADLAVAGGGPGLLPPGMPPVVSIVGNQEPSLADVGPGGTLKSWPTAIVSIDQSARATESSWSIDDGMWSAWERGGQLAVSAPSFLLQGHHSILFRTRPLGSRFGGWTSALDFLADYTPPVIELAQDAAGRWTLSAQDNFTPVNALAWSTSVAGGAPSDWSTVAPDPNALAARGPFLIRVRDQVGNVAQAASDPSLVTAGAAEGGSAARASAPAAARPATGCGTVPGEAGGALLGWLFALALTRLRRRSR